MIATDIKPMCIRCHKKPVVAKERGKWQTICWKCSNARFGRNARSRRKYRQGFMIPCEHCGRVPISLSDFDIDHIDGNRNNNIRSNLQSLCRSCHLTKTIQQREYLPRNERK